MKKIVFLILLSFSLKGICQPLNRTFENPNGSLKLLGQVTLDRLQDDPFEEWFNENFDTYEVSLEPIENQTLPDSITIFMGTWCGDSKREVPRFVKILEARNYDMDRLKIICLNSGFQNYKQAPEREERGVNIHRVPTFIFHESDGTEIGRLVEEPVVTLEEDISTVLSGQEYETAYPVAQKMIKYFDQYSLKEMKKRKSKLIAEFGERENVYELNTYGYVLWTSFQIPKAQFIFELNASLFPNEAITHQTLGRFMNSLGKEKSALSSVKKGLEIEPENERLLSLKADIETSLE